jgi:phosphoribosylanthranilate isomerase
MAAAQFGADAIGLVFYHASPRSVSVGEAREVLRGLPPFVTCVGLFVDAPEEEVRDILAEVPLDLLQFHGREPADYCRLFAKPYVKAVTVQPGRDLQAYLSNYDDAAGFLLDSYHPAVAGGSGVAFDWNLIPDGLERPVILAGGLHAGNVAEAIRRVRPYAVDVSSGVETAKGIKDSGKMNAFFAAVESANEKSGR